MTHTGPHQSLAVGDLRITKKVRMDDATARRLKRLARRMGVTESEVLRNALEQLDAGQDRARLVTRLQELFPAPPPPKVRFEAR